MDTTAATACVLIIGNEILSGKTQDTNLQFLGTELADKEAAELSVLEEYLPPQLSEDEIVALIRETVEAVGATGPRDRGKVMGRLMPQVRGKADGAEVNRLAGEILDSLG